MQLTEDQINLLIGLIIISICIYLIYIVIRTIFRIIKWILRSIWSLLTGKRKYEDPLQSKDWLVRAQARQEIRFQNSLPPLTSKPQKYIKPVFKKRKENKKWYPTGWYFDEQKGEWVAPDYIQKEANTKWQWDEDKRIWIDKRKNR